MFSFGGKSDLLWEGKDITNVNMWIDDLVCTLEVDVLEMTNCNYLISFGNV